MHEDDEKTPAEDGSDVTLEGHEPTGESVALSPYDSDLRSATTAAEPVPYRLDDSPAYDEAAAAEAATSPVEEEAPPAEEPPAEVDAKRDATGAPTTATAAVLGAGAVAASAAADSELTDTSARRSSLMQPRADSNEPRHLVADTEADARAERYAPASDGDLFAGATYDKVPSRGWAHWWGVLATLLLTPVAWYLISDAGARMTLPADNQWESGVLNLAAVGELLAGLVVLGAILLFARASSLGAFIVGSLVAVAGGAFVLFPSQTQEFLEPYLENLEDYNDFGANVAHHLVADGSTGRILVAGVALVMVGFVSHSARRRGRTEQQIREAIERRKATGF